ncbi:MAG: hypothetical protein AAGB29_09755 [Planctomycetota bacterium]
MGDTIGGRWAIVSALGLLTGLSGLLGCEPKATGPAIVVAPSISRDEALALVRRHNANAEKIEVVWCRLAIDLAWQEDGRRRRESGDGVLVYRKPGELALTVGKLGQEGLWAGGDGERYWMFDLREDVAWVGRETGLAEGRGGLPLPVQPADVARLLGWAPLDEASVERGSLISLGGRVLVEPRDEAGRATGRYVFEPDAVPPTRVDVLDKGGASIVTSRLSDPRRVAVSAGEAATFMTGVEIAVSDGSATMSMRVRGIETDGRRVRDAAFDLDRLMRAHRPERVIDVDEP